MYSYFSLSCQLKLKSKYSMSSDNFDPVDPACFPSDPFDGGLTLNSYATVLVPSKSLLISNLKYPVVKVGHRFPCAS